MDIIYRLSDNGYRKPKLPNATKQHCWENARKVFFLMGQFHLFVDETNLTPELKSYIEERAKDDIDPLAHFEYYTGGSSAGSWRHVFNYALNTLKDDDIVYFLEDDYLHVCKNVFLDNPDCYQIIMEGLNIVDYVSLYDHADKYIPASRGGNPFIGDDAAEITKVFVTKSTHWKLTNSTTMTFATRIKTLKEDLDIWTTFTQGSHPNDMGCFLALRDKGRSLATPIPGLSTHCEPSWASPLTNWEKV